MKILILGGDGMLGHQLLMLLRKRHDVRVTLRQEFPAYSGTKLFSPQNASAGIDVRATDKLLGVLSGFRLPAGPVKVGPFQTLALKRVR